MIDVHCHLQFHSFKDDYDTLAKQARDAGVKQIINVGTKLDSSEKAIEFADKYQEMYAVVGVHPHHADKLHANAKLETRNSNQAQNANSKTNDQGEDWVGELERMARHPKVIGIGEVGLDYFHYKSNGIVDPKIQKRVFETQIEIANRVKLPLQIHNRQAGEDIIEIIKYHKNLLQDVPGMFHCFAGSMSVVKSALDLGFYIGFDGNVTYDGLAPGETTYLKDLAGYVPLERLVVETDSPYLSPVPLRGTRNVPANVIVTAKFLADIKGLSYQKLVDQTTKNVYNIFGKMRLS